MKRRGIISLCIEYLKRKNMQSAFVFTKKTSSANKRISLKTNLLQERQKNIDSNFGELDVRHSFDQVIKTIETKRSRKLIEERMNISVDRTNNRKVSNFRLMKTLKFRPRCLGSRQQLPNVDLMKPKKFYGIGEFHSKHKISMMQKLEYMHSDHVISPSQINKSFDSMYKRNRHFMREDRYILNNRDTIF
jgi:hypothetical protein